MSYTKTWDIVIYNEISFVGKSIYNIIFKVGIIKYAISYCSMVKL
jgi:hypothetical protein